MAAAKAAFCVGVTAPYWRGRGLSSFFLAHASRTVGVEVKSTLSNATLSSASKRSGRAPTLHPNLGHKTRAEVAYGLLRTREG